MSYGDNSTNVAKGNFGENLTCYALSKQGWDVVPQPLKTDKTPASIVDIKATRDGKSIFVEVKTKNAFYWSDYFPVYTLETWKTNRLLQLQEQSGIELWLAVVDASRGGIFWTKISELIKPCVCQAYQFPVRHFHQKNQIINDYFHIDQFTLLEELTPDAKRYLGKYFDRDEFEPQEELGSDDMNDFPELENEIHNGDADDASTVETEDSCIITKDYIPRHIDFLTAPDDVSIPVFKGEDNLLLIPAGKLSRHLGFSGNLNVIKKLDMFKRANITVIRAKRIDGESQSSKQYFFLLNEGKKLLEAFCLENRWAGKTTDKYQRYLKAKQLLNKWDAMIAKFNGTPVGNNDVVILETANPLSQKYPQPLEQPAPKLTATTKALVMEEFANTYKIPVDEVKRFVIAAKCKLDPTLAELFGQLS